MLVVSRESKTDSLFDQTISTFDDDGGECLAVAFERFQHTGDSLRMGEVCKETAIVYQRAGDTEGALRYMRKAQGYGLSEGIYGRSMSILAKCHMDRGDLDSALYYARKADVLKAPGTDPYGYCSYQFTLATVHAARGENDLAEPYFKRALVVADSSGLPEQLLNAAAGFAKLLAAPAAEGGYGRAAAPDRAAVKVHDIGLMMKKSAAGESGWSALTSAPSGPSEASAASAASGAPSCTSRWTGKAAPTWASAAIAP